MPARASLDRLNKLAQERILILDGAMGTMIQRFALSEEEYRGDRWANHSCSLKDNHDLLVLSQRQIISSIHRQYLDAGADIITTNTFNANAWSQSDFGLESLTYELNVEAARLARSAADEVTAQWPSRPRLVAGSMGPSNRVVAVSPTAGARLKSVSVDEMKASYVDQVRGLIDGGVDVLLLETIVDLTGALAAIDAIRGVQREKNSALPLMLSFTIVGDGDRLLSGETIAEFYGAIESAEPWSIGINCAPGTARTRPHLAALSRMVSCWVSAHPNAGLPDAHGNYAETPAETAALLKEYADRGIVNIVGGCCGTTPNHIRAIAEAVDNARPRVKPTLASDGDLLPLEQARANRLRTDWDTILVPVPWFVGHRIISDQRLDDLLPFVNIQGIDSHRARTILNRIVKERKLQAHAVYGFWPANTDVDEVIVYKDDGRRDELLRFHMLRQQTAGADRRANLSLADFIAPVGSLIPDYIGAFALTAGVGLDALVNEYERANDAEAATIVGTLADRLATAFAEFLHTQARDEGGYGHAQGMRISFGDAASPDLTENTTLFRLLGAPNLGIKLTEQCAVAPASIAGIYLSHAGAAPFNVGRIGRDQLEGYAARKGISVEEAEQLCRSQG